MPSEKKKAKKQKIKIKQEPQEIHPLSHYVDDRVELIKQVFSTLKPKVIKNVAPAEISRKTILELQELCLDEILGISKKRLLSIINSTKCPTNTDSSDSDVEKIEEHISLDEISSDEEVKAENNSSKKIKKTGKKDKNGKEMTVLELLELQARARAIRSQLALEPITKIELDSEDSDTEKQTPETLNKAPEKQKVPEKTQKNIISAPSTSKADESQDSQVPPPTRVRLKRNFRKRPSVDAESSPKQRVTTVEVIEKKISPARKKPESDNSRGSSPDVIAMHASPETLCISSDDEVVVHKKEDLIADKKFVQSIFAASVEKEDTKSPEKSPEPENVKSPEKEKVYEEPEEGEYSESESEIVEQKSVEMTDDIVELVVDSKEVSSESDSDQEPHIPEDNLIKSENTSISNKSDSGDDQEMEQSDQVNEENPHTEDEKIVESFEVVEKVVQPPQEINSHDPDDEDIVEILNSSDEDMLGELDEKATPVEAPESWESRWLDSNNVKKILATSKLQNKVRAKRTKKNFKSDTSSSSDAKSPASEMEQVQDSVEEGSVQQFDVLKETSNSSS